MTLVARIKIIVIAAIIGPCALELGERLAIPGMHAFISPAEAVVGRPLTPVSAAGVARRTARRCANGTYNC